MITITYVNNVSGNLETIYIPRDMLKDVLATMLESGITIQEIHNS